MTGPEITERVILAVTAFSVAYTVFARVYWGVEATVSHVMLAKARECHWLPWAFGMLLGHWFCEWDLLLTCAAGLLSGKLVWRNR